MKVYLVCFDITDDKIRRRVGNFLEHHGDRVQYSVFEIAIKQDSELDELREKIRDLLEPGDDVRFYYLNAEARRLSHNCHQQAVAQFPAAIVL